MIDTSKITKRAKEFRMLNLGPSRLVVLSNRGPYATAVVRRRLAVRRNTGGLVTAMEPVLRSQGGVWIAWDDPPPGRPRPPSPPEARPPFSPRLLPLNEPAASNHYYGFASRAM